MDSYGFAKPGTEFAKPQLEDYAEDQGYDYYGYDMALEQWLSQFPNLSEQWCGEVKPVPQAEQELSLTQQLEAALAA